jgi:CHAP domain
MSTGLEGRGGDRDGRPRPERGRRGGERIGKPNEAEARHVLDLAFAEYQPIALYAMFSGGHDSLVAANLAAQHPSFTGCVHIDTGVGIEETREFVHETCHREGWPLVELVTPPSVYEELVLTYGFPGYGMHSGVYQRLKERRLADLVRQAKAGRSRLVVVALATGDQADGERATDGPRGPSPEGGVAALGGAAPRLVGDRRARVHGPSRPVVGDPRWNHPAPLFGNAIDLYGAAVAERFTVSRQPVTGAMVVYGASYRPFGHIATVVAVHQDRYEVIEQNFLDFNPNLESHWQTFDPRSIAWPDPAVTGFIVAPR